MTEEELENEAWVIHKEALQSIDLPSNIVVTDDKDGSFSLRIVMESESSGVGIFYYRPPTAFIKKILQMDDHSSPIIMVQSMRRNLAFGIAQELLKNFHLEFVDTFLDIYQFPFLLYSNLSKNALDEFGKGSYLTNTSMDPKVVFENFLNERTARIRERFAQAISEHQKPSQPVRHLLAYFFDKFTPEWEKAAKCYGIYKDDQDWRKRVNPEPEQLPPDLVELLANEEAETENKLESYLVTPTVLALRHAARWCGISDNSLGRRALYKIVEKSQKWIEENGQEAVEREVFIYESNNFESLKINCQMFQWLGKALEIENLPFIQQFLAEKFDEHLPKITEENSVDKISELTENSSVH